MNSATSWINLATAALFFAGSVVPIAHQAWERARKTSDPAATVKRAFRIFSILLLAAGVLSGLLFEKPFIATLLLVPYWYIATQLFVRSHGAVDKHSIVLYVHETTSFTFIIFFSWLFPLMESLHLFASNVSGA